MTQATTTMGLSLNADLPDSLFVFTPPAGAVETADWTLPGITKPDLEGKPAPAIKGAPPIKGKVVLLNFWTAWSAPCKTELPILDKLQKQFRAQGLVVLGMNVGNDQAAVTFPTIHLKDDDELLKTLSVNAYPTLILIDRTGKIALYEVGAKTEPALRAALAKLGIKPETTPAKPPVPKTAK
jgi:thiol-disulfide isomerase/thioredoxin